MHAQAVQDLNLTEAELLAALISADCHRHAEDVAFTPCASVVMLRNT